MANPPVGRADRDQGEDQTDDGDPLGLKTRVAQRPPGVAVNGNGENQNNGAFSKFVFLMYVAGAVGALVTGITVWIRGHSRELPGDVRAGQVAVACFVLSFVVFAVATAVG